MTYARYSTDGRRVLDGDLRVLCTCIDEATAKRVADALKHLAEWEYQSAPMTEEELAELQRSLEAFVAEYDAEHPNFKPGVLARALGID